MKKRDATIMQFGFIPFRVFSQFRKYRHSNYACYKQLRLLVQQKLKIVVLFHI